MSRWVRSAFSTPFLPASSLHGDTADTQRTAVVEEEILGRHGADRGGDALAHRQGHARCEITDQRNQHEPHGKRTGTDVGRIFQSDDVAQAQHGGSGIDLEDHLELVGDHLAPGGHAGRNGIGPQTDRTGHEVIQTTHQSADGEHLGLITLLFARDQDLGRRGGLGEGILAVHVLHEVAAEGNQQHDTQHAAEERREEDLVELRLQTENVKCRQGEDRTGDDHARTGADGLDNGVLTEHVLLARERTHSHGDDGDRDGRLEHLAHLQPQIGSRGREDDGHQ